MGNIKTNQSAAFLLIPTNESGPVWYRGWAGDSAGQISVESITHSISVIKTTEDCPFIKAWFEEAGKTVKELLVSKMSK